jgi:arsenite methyltransferase
MTYQQQSLEAIQRYYGEVLKSTEDLQTSACCIGEAPPPHITAALQHVHEEVKARFYGCGSPIPLALEGTRVLDLGCGTGRDCYVLSQLVGPTGSVIGVDMTEGQLAVARKHLDYHVRKVGYANIEFRDGYIEDLGTARIADASVDVVVSNCVLNLSPDKPSVFREIFRVLKPGGELYFSDVFSNRRIPANLAEDPILRGECLGGALYWEDFRRLLADVGCADSRISQKRLLAINNPDIERKVETIGFHAITIRAFKMALEDRCEDFGQAVMYRGTIAEAPEVFDLDDHHRFETGRTVAVCGNTADMIAVSRYARHFSVIGDKARHFGLFDCADDGSNGQDKGAGAPCC